MNQDSRKLYLGVDGGQSHTEAVIADEQGKILGRGMGGPSNHAEQPGGRERLKDAILSSVGRALRCTSGSDEPMDELVTSTTFASAHCGMTGGAVYKEEVISAILNANVLTVGHDAPIALVGATAGEPGVAVIAGTGSVVYADDRRGKTSQVGGLGYLFSDEGSGFWLAAQTLRLAIKEQDRLIPESGVRDIVLQHFGVTQLRDVTDGFYNGLISRDAIAKLSRDAHDAAEGGNRLLDLEIKRGARILVEGVISAAQQVGFGAEFLVAGIGGMFRARLHREAFAEALSTDSPGARFSDPLYGPAEGALMLAFEQFGSKVSGIWTESDL